MDGREPADCHGRPGCIVRAIPTGARDRDPGVEQPVDGSECEAFGLAIVPAEAREHADVLSDLLLHVQAHAVLQGTDLPRSRHVGHAAGLAREGECFRVAAGIGVVQVSEQPHRPGMLRDLVADLLLERVAAIAEQPAVEAQAIGDLRFGYTRVTHGPGARMKLVHPSPGVAACIGRIIPGAVVHDGPAHELGARVVRVAVVVEEIGEREPAGDDGVAGHRPLAAELIVSALNVLFLIAEAEIVRNIKARNVRLGRRARHARQLAVGEVGETRDSAEAPASGDLGIEIELRVPAEAQAEKQCGGQRNVLLRIILEAVHTAVGRVKCPVVLADRGSLIEKIPALGLGRGRAGLGGGQRRHRQRQRIPDSYRIPHQNAKLDQINTAVSAIMMTAVAQAMAFPMSEFLYLPITCGRLTSTSMEMSTNGSRIPFATCENRMNFNRGNLGISTTPAPQAINPVYSQ